MTEGNGETPPTMSPEELTLQLHAGISARLAQLAAFLTLPLSAADREKLAARLVSEQLEVMRTIIPSMLNPNRNRTHPLFGIRIQRAEVRRIVTAANPRGEGAEQQVVVAPKRVAASAGVSRPRVVEISAHVILVALLLEPAIRGLLHLYGLQYDFVELALAPAPPHAPAAPRSG